MRKDYPRATTSTARCSSATTRHPGGRAVDRGGRAMPAATDMGPSRDLLGEAVVGLAAARSPAISA
jgi:hypothetical protein